MRTKNSVVKNQNTVLNHESNWPNWPNHVQCCETYKETCIINRGTVINCTSNAGISKKKKKEKKPFGNKSKNINEICFQCFQGPFFSVIHNL